MFDKLGDFYNLFRAGQSVADAAGLKNKQMLINALTGFLGGLLAIGKLYGITLPLDADSIHYIAGFGAVVFGLFNVGATVASSDKIGLLPSLKTKDICGTDFGVSLPVPAVAESNQPTSDHNISSTDYPSLNGIDSTYNG